MSKKVIGWLIVVILIGLLSWIGLSFYSCYQSQQLIKTTESKIPNFEDAAYIVRIKNTNNLLLTNDVQLILGYGCDDINEDIYELHGYWRVVGDAYEYVDKTLRLDEAVFGPIIVKRRQ